MKGLWRCVEGSNFDDRGEDEPDSHLTSSKPEMTYRPHKTALVTRHKAQEGLSKLLEILPDLGAEPIAVGTHVPWGRIRRRKAGFAEHINPNE